MCRCTYVRTLLNVQFGHGSMVIMYVHAVSSTLSTLCGPPSQSRCPVVWEWEKRPGYWRVLKMDEEARLEKAFQDYSAALDKAQAGTEQIDKLRSQTIDLQGAEWTVRVTQ